jgi:hypothetical protein
VAAIAAARPIQVYIAAKLHADTNDPAQKTLPAYHRPTSDHLGSAQALGCEQPVMNASLRARRDYAETEIMLTVYPMI